MFRALYAHHQEVDIYIYICIYIYSNNPSPLACFQSDDTRCCINTIQLPDDEHIMLETCRGL